jgi:hypothetical protein
VDRPSRPQTGQVLDWLLSGVIGGVVLAVRIPALEEASGEGTLAMGNLQVLDDPPFASFDATDRTAVLTVCHVFLF